MILLFFFFESKNRRTEKGQKIYNPGLQILKLELKILTKGIITACRYADPVDFPKMCMSARIVAIFLLPLVLFLRLPRKDLLGTSIVIMSGISSFRISKVALRHT